jgi:hypothetical protein
MPTRSGVKRTGRSRNKQQRSTNMGHKSEIIFRSRDNRKNTRSSSKIKEESITIDC